ncbi:hypothetical protein RHGRI_002220 [Rhododendron griersonianum]|uniref:Uncharacterized protein n=1 Tax=Rhododendron griersonianum TaxID=479676 RepID=A0AAV6LR93_9ERIC|nr:hypothetical protein RHGRI_002220 [Rhododendron griersonianum]
MGDPVNLGYIISPLIKDYQKDNIVTSLGIVEDSSQSFFFIIGSSVDLQHRKGGTGGSSFGEKSTIKAIDKMERRLRRSKRKIMKKKLLVELGVKANKVSRKKMMIPSSSLSSGDIKNRNSLLFKGAREMIDIGARLGIQ